MSITQLFQNLKTVFIYKRKGRYKCRPLFLICHKIHSLNLFAEEIETTVFNSHFVIKTVRKIFGNFLLCL
jgi:hypothetical protein